MSCGSTEHLWVGLDALSRVLEHRPDLSDERFSSAWITTGDRLRFVIAVAETVSMNEQLLFSTSMTQDRFANVDGGAVAHDLYRLGEMLEDVARYATDTSRRLRESCAAVAAIGPYVVSTADES